jgi:hypothetical protein
MDDAAMNKIGVNDFKKTSCSKFNMEALFEALLLIIV